MPLIWNLYLFLLRRMYLSYTPIRRSHKVAVADYPAPQFGERTTNIFGGVQFGEVAEWA
jgi:hypothetical protein